MPVVYQGSTRPTHERDRSTAKSGRPSRGVSAQTIEAEYRLLQRVPPVGRPHSLTPLRSAANGASGLTGTFLRAMTSVGRLNQTVKACYPQSRGLASDATPKASDKRCRLTGVEGRVRGLGRRRGRPARISQRTVCVSSESLGLHTLVVSLGATSPRRRDVCCNRWRSLETRRTHPAAYSQS